MTLSVPPTAAEYGQSTTESVLLAVDDVAALLAASPRIIRRMADAGQMPSPVRLNSLVRWRRSDIDDWLAAGCPRCDRRRARS